ncbi:MAG TPA: sugar-binding domain-containing protein [Chloroflexota bacterium]|nr:sugar-binding domain-containing protein [Chloroflexota bacterium]
MPGSAYDVARFYYSEGRPSQEEVAQYFNETRDWVRARLTDARLGGLIHTVITPSGDQSDSIQELAFQLMDRWMELKAHVIPGLERVMDEPPGDADKEAILLCACQTAGDVLEELLSDLATRKARDRRASGQSSPSPIILAVPWGRVAYYTARLLRPKRALATLEAVPMCGVTGYRANPYEANTVAEAFASAYGGTAMQLASPAVVPSADYDTVVTLPLVKEALEHARLADIAITTVAAANENTSTLARSGIVSYDYLRKVRAEGAAGEIAGYWWFKADGQAIVLPTAVPVGLGVEGLSALCAAGKHVIAVVAASNERVEPLRIALDHGFVNTLVTDEYTARQLLK